MVHPADFVNLKSARKVFPDAISNTLQYPIFTGCTIKRTEHLLFQLGFAGQWRGLGRQRHQVEPDQVALAAPDGLVPLHYLF